MDIAITRAFDYFVVYPARQIFNDPIREKYYGGWGNYREKEYGVECRSLGGYFLQEKYLGWVFDQTMKALEFCKNDKNVIALLGASSPNISTEENYNALSINLKEQIYVSNNTAISSSIIS